MQATRSLPTPRVKKVYCLALLSVIPSLMLGAASWLGLLTGGGLLLFIQGTGFWVILVLAVYRAYRVIRVPALLDAYAPGGLALLTRKIAIGAMYVGVAATAVLFGVMVLGSLKLLRFDPIVLFMISIPLFFLSNLGWFGVLLFELSRLLGGGVPIPRPARDWTGIGRRGAVIVAVLGSCVVIAWGALTMSSLRNGYQDFVHECQDLPEAVVLRRADKNFKSVLVDAKSLEPLGIRYTLSAVTVSAPLPFIEQCFRDRCEKVLNSSGSDKRVRERIDKPESEIALVLLLLGTRELAFEGAIHEIEYSLRDRQTDEVFASARERVFHWGKYPSLRHVMLVGAVDPHEACGYAGREPHPYRPAGVSAYVPDAYVQADMALVASILPR